MSPLSPLCRSELARDVGLIASKLAPTITAVPSAPTFHQRHGIKRRTSLINTDRIDHLYKDRHEKDVRFFLHYGDALAVCQPQGDAGKAGSNGLPDLRTPKAT